MKVALWKSALTQAEEEALTNQTFGTVSSTTIVTAPGHLVDVAGKHGADVYTKLGITQPHHEWVFDTVDPLTDKGSTGGFDLTAVGTAKGPCSECR